jgi:soluble lytic murein transglycosylase-like protein
MEKRPKKTLARTLSCRARCAKVVLAAALFAPGFFASVQVSEKTRPATASDVKVVEVSEKPRPKEHIKIYSIVKSHRPDIADSEIWNVSEVILEESSKRKLDPLLVLALIRIESGFQYAPVSPSGARGIMQIMPETGKSLAKSLSREYGLKPIAFRPESLDDPLLNIQLGIYYLHGLKKQFRDLSLALSAYNAGPVAIQSRLDNNLELADEFAALVLDAYERYKNAKHPLF